MVDNAVDVSGRAAWFFGAVLAIGVLGGVVGGKFNAALISAVLLAQIVLHLILVSGCWDKCLKKPQNGDKEAPLLETEAPAQPQKAPTQRYLYVENLKFFLAIAVVICHSSMTFCPGFGWIYVVGSGDSGPGFRSSPLGIALMAWFEAGISCAMMVFFFLAGYFVPSAYAKKGTKVFLLERLSRLGIPLMVFVWVVCPLCLYGIQRWTLGTVAHAYYPMPLHMWFALWLLLLSEAYALMMHGRQEIKLPLPSMFKLVGLGCVIGAFETLVILAGVDNVFSMPIGNGSIFFDIASFWAGCVGKNSKWLDDFAAATGSYSAAAQFIFFWSYFFTNVALYERHGGDVMRDMVNADAAKTLYTFMRAILLGMWAGAGSMIYSTGFMKVFQTCFDFQNRWTARIAALSYSVYIVHPLVIVPVTMANVSILKYLADAPVTSSSVLIDIPMLLLSIESTVPAGGSLLSIAWFLQVFISVPLVVLVSYGLSKVPCLKGIL